MKIISLLLFLSAFSNFSYAAIVEPFVPVLAADQPRISMKSIEYEGLQFRAIGDWASANDEVSTKQYEKDQAQKTFESTKELFEENVVSEDQFNAAKLNLQVAEYAFNIAKADLMAKEADALKFKFLLLSEGNPDMDYRKDLAATLKRQFENTIVVLGSIRDSVKAASDYWRLQVRNGETLFQKGFFTQTELRARHLQLETTVGQLRTLDYKIAAAQESIKGLERTLSIL